MDATHGGRLGALVLWASMFFLFGGLASAYADASDAAERDTIDSRLGVQPPPPVVDPYKASLAFAVCMRRHGIAYPNPDRTGNFHLRPRDEERLRRSSRREREAAEKACFRHLRPVVSTKPLSSRARTLAKRELRAFGRCMRAEGFDFYFDPVVRNLSRGRAFFGFDRTDPAIRKVERSKAFLGARTSCERKLNAKLDRIIANDRGAWVP
jgi:hypothetical protein